MKQNIIKFSVLVLITVTGPLSNAKTSKVDEGKSATHINLWQVQCKAWTTCKNGRVIWCSAIDKEICTSNFVSQDSVICSTPDGIWQDFCVD